MPLQNDTHCTKCRRDVRVISTAVAKVLFTVSLLQHSLRAHNLRFAQTRKQKNSSSPQPEDTKHGILKGTCGHPLVLHDLKQDKQHFAFFQRGA